MSVKHVSDHCTTFLRFLVEEAGVLANWSLCAEHSLVSGGCEERFALNWWPDRAKAYVAALKANTDLQGQSRYC